MSAVSVDYSEDKRSEKHTMETRTVKSFIGRCNLLSVTFCFPKKLKEVPLAFGSRSSDSKQLGSSCSVTRSGTLYNSAVQGGRDIVKVCVCVCSPG